MPELRAAVETEAGNAQNREVHRQHVPLLAAGVITGRPVNRADFTVRKRGGVEASRLLRILVEPEANRVLWLHVRVAPRARLGPMRLLLRTTADFKTALRSLSALATFANGYANDLGDEALHCQAHPRVFPGQRRQRTSEPTDDVSAVSLDLCRGAQLVVQHLARHRHS